MLNGINMDRKKKLILNDVCTMIKREKTHFKRLRRCKDNIISSSFSLIYKIRVLKFNTKEFSLLKTIFKNNF